jgi:membrane associated rhomboid family serine protease
MFPVRDSIPARNFPFAMFLLIGVNVAIYFLQAQLPHSEMEALLSTFGVVPARDFADVYDLPLATQAEPYFSSIFLHGSFLHLFSNMWSLWLFGDNVEDRMGHLRFLIFYVLCGLIAGLSHSILNPGSWLPAVGASGAISGVMGAYLLMFPRSRLVMVTLLIFYPIVFEMPAVLFLIFWFIGQLFGGTYTLGQTLSDSSAQAGGIAFWAHIGGFLAGIALMPFFRRSS